MARIHYIFDIHYSDGQNFTDIQMLNFKGKHWMDFSAASPTQSKY